MGLIFNTCLRLFANFIPNISVGFGQNLNISTVPLDLEQGRKFSNVSRIYKTNDGGDRVCVHFTVTYLNRTGTRFSVNKHSK